MTSEDQIAYKPIYDKQPTSVIIHEDLKVISRLHAKYFNHKEYVPCTCNWKLVKKWINALNELYEEQL